MEADGRSHESSPGQEGEDSGARQGKGLSMEDGFKFRASATEKAFLS